ncbi:MAG: N-acetylmuramoyl-L-alanine amidase [Desulfovibrionaceae bacterium]|nr:N-acetylmuramoyl-L-alanine amidase [Desulfovibrionaceae bacterium]
MNSAARYKRRSAALILVLACLAWPAGRALGATPAGLFNRAHAGFHELNGDRERSLLRSEWKKVEREFLGVYKQDPKGAYAPKSLYYLARVHEELGNRSGLNSDFRKAEDYYGRMIGRFPRHAWTDDSLFRRAEIRLKRLDLRSLAQKDFETIVENYPRSDMFSQARIELAELAGPAAAQKEPEPSPGPVAAQKEAEPRSGPKVAASADPLNRAHLLRVRYTSSNDYTRVVLDLDEQVNYRYQLLAPLPEMGRPNRLYIDLVNTMMGNDVEPEVDIKDGILKGVRVGRRETEVTRVVLDFQKLQDYKVFPLQNPFRIVVDVYSNGKAAPTPTLAAAAPAGGAKKVTGSKGMAGDLVEQLGLTIRTIMIDPGHGGHDPGCTANGLKEKDVNLAFAKVLGRILEDKGFRVLYTRETDRFVRLEQRTAMANVKKADLFVSVHCNANRSSRISGLETYTLNLTSDEDAKRVAARENAVDPKSISDLQFILSDLVRSSKLRESNDLARDIQDQTLRSVSARWEVRDHGVREAPFYVLMGAKMPSVLVELGYLTNKTEARRLGQEVYLKHLARGVVNGVMSYKGQIERYIGG